MQLLAPQTDTQVWEHSILLGQTITGDADVQTATCSSTGISASVTVSVLAVQPQLPYTLPRMVCKLLPSNALLSGSHWLSRLTN